MPSSTAKQAKLMRAVAHNPAFAKKVGIPQSVGKDFAEADKGRKFGSGGSMKESKAMVKKEMAFMKKKGAPKSMIQHEAREHESIGMENKVKKMADGGMAGMADNRYQRMMQGADGMDMGRDVRDMAGMGGAPMPGMGGGRRGFGMGRGMGGRGMNRPDGGMMRRPAMPQSDFKKGGSVGGGYRRAADGIASKGKTKGSMVKMAKGGEVGGSYRRAADGIATKGKTKGKMVKMNKGGYC